jgi:multiple sugar transport system permease protein
LGIVVLAGLAPFTNALFTSFFSVDQVSNGNPVFVGLENYARLFSDRGFPLSAGLTLAWALLSASLTMLAAYPLACLIHASRKAYLVVFPVLVAAWATPVYIGAPLWRFLLHGAAGDSLFRTLTGITVNLMESPSAAFIATALVAAWFRLPQAVFILLAAMSRSRRDLDDAAAVDGAGPAALAFVIRLPAMIGTLGAVAAMELVSAFKEFTVPFLMTAGGPPMRAGITRQTVIGATTTLEVYLFDMFSAYTDSGVVSAYAVVLSLFVALAVYLGLLAKGSLRRLTRGRRLSRNRFQRSMRRGSSTQAESITWIPGRFSDTGFNAGSWTLVFLLLAAGLALVWCLLWMAFSGLSVAFVDGFLPSYPTAGNFAAALIDDGLGLAVLNTLVVSATTAALTGLIVFPAATWLAEQTLARAALVFILLQALASTGGVHSLIPLYDLWRRLGLLGGYGPVILVYLYHSIPIALFALSSFLRDQPRSFREAARLEGMGMLAYIFRVQLPLSLPAIGTTAMIAFLSAWNGFLAPLVFLDDDARYTVAVKLHAYVGSIASGAPKWNRFAAASIMNIAIIGILFWRFKRPLTKTSLADHNED